MPKSTTTNLFCTLTSTTYSMKFDKKYKAMKKLSLLFTLIAFSSIVIAQNWSQVNSGTSLKLNSISFGSKMVGYIGANDSTLLKTIDGGLTWNVQPTNGVFFSTNLPNITQVDFVTPDVGYLMIGTQNYSGGMYKTIDGGMNWTAEMVSMCSPLFCYNFDEDNSYVVGSSCFGGKTIDKKVNGSWQSNTAYLTWSIEYLRSITFYDTDFGITAGDSGLVHRTFDGGTTWDTVSTITNEIIWDLQFINDSTIFAVADSMQNTLMISTDSGSTWQSHNNSLTFFYPALFALAGDDDGLLLAVGQTYPPNEGMIIWGNEIQNFWRYETAPNKLNDVTLSDDAIAFAVGDTGLIMTNNGMLNGIDNIGREAKVHVYPNPTKDFFSVTHSSANILSVRVVDIQGKQVLNVNTQFNQVEVSQLASGFYFVEIQTSKGKMVQSLMVE